jgi:hypothetical protein
MANAMAIRV